MGPSLHPSWRAVTPERAGAACGACRPVRAASEPGRCLRLGATRHAFPKGRGGSGDPCQHACSDPCSRQLGVFKVERFYTNNPEVCFTLNKIKSSEHPQATFAPGVCAEQGWGGRVGGHPSSPGLALWLHLWGRLGPGSWALTDPDPALPQGGVKASLGRVVCAKGRMK